jgi:Deoxyribonuclease II
MARSVTLSARCLIAVLLLVISSAFAADAPSPLLATGQPVDWWFVFKFHTESFQGCGGTAKPACLFGGTVQNYPSFSQQFAFASSLDGTLKQGGGCLGDTTADPVGATFNQIYKGKLFYVLWNDQFYSDPIVNKYAPAGHSKGMMAWDNDGNGFVMQVSTPSWPGSGSSKTPRKTDGNTLGCVKDNDVYFSQHFFALKLKKDDVTAVLKALQNASVVTDPNSKQVVSNGGPADIQALVKVLGSNSTSKTATQSKLSSGVTLISKPSNLQVPPWQMVSALLGGEPLRAATWYASPEIPTTTTSGNPACWDSSLGTPGAVENATSGMWMGTPIGLRGIPDPNGNHAKIGVSTAAGTHTYSIFGDMNQQGALSGNCKSSQNGRGGLFFVIEQAQLFQSITALIKGDTAPGQ